MNVQLDKEATRKLRDEFESDALVVFRRDHAIRSAVVKARKWSSCFGVSSEVCVDVWIRIDPANSMPKGAKTHHLLWALYFLNVYPRETQGSSNIGGVDEKTYRKWVWLFVTAISYLEYPVVSW